MDLSSLLDYELPENRIAQEPLEDRASARLLHVEPGTGRLTDRNFRDVTTLLKAGDLLVLNNTRVTARRLVGHRETGGKTECFLLHETEPGVFQSLLKPAKRLKIGEKIQFPNDLLGEVTGIHEDGTRSVQMTHSSDLEAAIRNAGEIPLPPYIAKSLADEERYQTVYAKTGGSAAAPTAGLHFTDEVLADLVSKGVNLAWVTLDVSLDTFRPIQVENPLNHVMHGEMCHLPPETAKAIEDCTGRVIAVGTTTTRTLESFGIGPRQVKSGSQHSKLFISPGYKFQVIDGMFTNFHMPRTTMLLMISALAGIDQISKAYRHALENEYRFLSFGDSMLIL